MYTESHRTTKNIDTEATNGVTGDQESPHYHDEPSWFTTGAEWGSATEQPRDNDASFGASEINGDMLSHEGENQRNPLFSPEETQSIHNDRTERLKKAANEKKKREACNAPVIDVLVKRRRQIWMSYPEYFTETYSKRKTSAAEPPKTILEEYKMLHKAIRSLYDGIDGGDSSNQVAIDGIEVYLKPSVDGSKNASQNILNLSGIHIENHAFINTERQKNQEWDDESLHQLASLVKRVERYNDINPFKHKMTFSPDGEIDESLVEAARNAIAVFDVSVPNYTNGGTTERRDVTSEIMKETDEIWQNLFRRISPQGKEDYGQKATLLLYDQYKQVNETIEELWSESLSLGYEVDILRSYLECANTFLTAKLQFEVAQNKLKTWQSSYFENEITS